MLAGSLLHSTNWKQAGAEGVFHGCDESCVRCRAVRDDSFQQIWSCFVINAIPHDNIRKSQDLFQRAKREKNMSPCFWTRGTVAAEWMEVPAAWEFVEPRVKHNSCDALKEWAKRNCLIMFLDGTGGPFSSDPVLRRCAWEAVLDFTDVFAPSIVFGRGGGLLGAKQTVSRRARPSWSWFPTLSISCPRPRERGRTPWGNAAICGSVGCLLNTTLR